MEAYFTFIILIIKVIQFIYNLFYLKKQKYIKAIILIEIILYVLASRFGFYIYDLFLYYIVLYNLIILLVNLSYYKQWKTLDNIVLTLITIILYIVYNFMYIIDIKYLANYKVQNWYPIYTNNFSFRVKYIVVNIDNIKYYCNSTNLDYCKNIPLAPNKYYMKSIKSVDDIEITQNMQIYYQQHFTKKRRSKNSNHYNTYYYNLFDVYIIDNSTNMCYYICLINLEPIYKLKYEYKIICINKTHSTLDINIDTISTEFKDYMFTFAIFIIIYSAIFKK